jgi:probable rRNA maturation factor
MEILIRNQQKLPLSTARVRRHARRVLRSENCPEDVEVSIVLTDDESIRELNRTYLGKDQATDVLAFAQDGDSEELAPGEPRLLGDVVVSVETAKAQAEERGKPLDDEVDLLVGHGLLHLLGYDDGTPEEREEMNRRVAEVLGEDIAR